MTFARTYPRIPPPVPGPVIAAGATAFAGIMFFAALISAYLGITVLLSALPLVLLGAGWWLARRFRDPREGGG